MKNVRKSERKIAELTFQQDEDRKNRERMQVSFYNRDDNIQSTSWSRKQRVGRLNASGKPTAYIQDTV